MGKQHEYTMVDLPLIISISAYDAGDVVGGQIEIPMAAIPVGGMVAEALLFDDDDRKAALSLHLFDSQPAVIADQAAFALAFADLKKEIGEIAFATAGYRTHNGNAYSRVGGNDALTGEKIEFRTKKSGTLWAYLVTPGGVTYLTTTALYLRLKLLVN